MGAMFSNKFCKIYKSVIYICVFAAHLKTNQKLIISLNLKNTYKIS